MPVYDILDQPNLAQINWTLDYMGTGVVLGQIDGYPALGHPEITGSAATYRTSSLATFAPMSWNADHATGALGIVCSRVNGEGGVGVAPGTYSWVVPIWTNADKAVYKTESARTSLLNTAYSFFTTKGVKCVNRELSSSRAPWGMEGIWGPNDLALVAKHNKYVHVQAAGNQGLPIGNHLWNSTAASLAHMLICIGVDGNNALWPGSNTPQARGLYRTTDKFIKPENFWHNFCVCAPAVGVLMPASPTGYQTGWVGTSFAAPHVQGLVALMYDKASQLGRVLTPVQCCDIIKSTCTPLGPRELFGKGMINVQAALAAIT